MEAHELYMRRCLELAQRGAGGVSPNPMVGALLVYDGKIIAENYHRVYGGPHAEVLVVEEVKAQYGADAMAILARSTLYVSLEPCAHYGKTPPCANMLAEHRIGRVVVACRDPFDRVNGQGIVILRAAGIEVIEGVLAEESRWLNRRFITRIRQQRPYIILKWAQTADGFMAPSDGSQHWITGAEARQLVHRWRSEEDAILVGANTVFADNPQLTVRDWEGRNPRRVVIDKHLATPPTAKIFDAGAETVVFNAVKTDWTGNIKLVELENFDLYLPQQIVYQLYLMDVQSLIVEGGRKTLNIFLESGLWDEARILTAPDVWGKGVAAPTLHQKPTETQAVGRDRLEVVYKYEFEHI